MRISGRCAPAAASICVASLLGLVAQSAAADDQVAIGWQHQHKSIAYVGLTTLYVCDSLENQVRRILKYLGARDGLRVLAACSQPIAPTRQAVVDVDFFTPVPAAAPGADASIGHWVTVGLEAGHPNFIGAGDCDLLQDMKEVIVGSFTLRNLKYSTSCFPNDLTLHDFRVSGQALKVSVPPAAP